MDPTEEDVNSHFEELGDINLDSEDGEKIGITTYVCQACGSLVIIRRAHWNTHQSLPTAWV